MLLQLLVRKILYLEKLIDREFMRILNYTVNKTPILFSDGSYSLCNLNNFNKNVYYNMFPLKIDIKTDFIDKKISSNKSELLYLNTRKKMLINRKTL